MGPRYIQWPSPEERVNIKRTFERRSGYPGVVGCVDGTHTYITAPFEDKQAFVNRHHSHPILTQAVVDFSLLVTDLYVGEAGSLHDARMFRRSPLSRNLENRGLLSEGGHILGDGAYTLTDKVIVPYADNGRLSEAQKLHTTTLSRCRATVERGFGLCKGRCRRLKLMESHSVDIAVDHITACFVLHNFMILSGEEMEAQENFDNEVEDGVNDQADVNEGEGDNRNAAVERDHPLLEEARIDGEEKRDEIAANLFLAARRRN